MNKPKFEVDPKGLAKLLERRGKAFLVYELVQNAWDTGATEIDVKLEMMSGGRYAMITVTDNDPNGFLNITHAYTLFAESTKKKDPQKRGRFNLGDKLVLALCKEAWITSTCGSFRFDENGRHTSRQRRDSGTEFKGIFKVTRAEFEEILVAARRMIPTNSQHTIINGVPLETPELIGETVVQLPTEISDEEGVLRRSSRNTTVLVFKPRAGEVGWLLEMGIPVCETGDAYHICVEQKIPLNMDRDNVSASYLSKVRAVTLNMVSGELSAEAANSTWVRDACQTDEVSADSIERVITLRFGERRVTYDPSDVEANKRAVSAGYTVIHGSMLNAKEWENVRGLGLALPAGKVTPSKPTGSAPAVVVSPASYSEGMRMVVEYSTALAHKLLGASYDVIVLDSPQASTLADFSRDGRMMRFNVGRLGEAWFARGVTPDVNALIIHEFGHHYSGDHLSSTYYDALCDLGARLAETALADPTFFARFRRTP